MSHAATATSGPGPVLTTFCGAAAGEWHVSSQAVLAGPPLPAVAGLRVVSGPLPAASAPAAWQLRGVASHLRYTTRREKTQLDATPSVLGRAEATCAALIPLQKSAEWWGLTQEERRGIFEEQSHHISATLKYLPLIARQLYHARDLGESFDFLTWFEFEPRHAAQFDELVYGLRTSPEWRFVTREIDIRLVRPLPGDLP